MDKAVRHWTLVGLAAAAACGFGSDGDTTGAVLGSGMSATDGDGDGDGTDGGSIGGNAGASGDGTGGSMSGAGSITSPTSGMSDDGMADSTDDGVADDGPPMGGPCDNPPTETFTFTMADAIVNGPMNMGIHPTHGLYMYSTTPNAGVVSFLFDPQCAGTFFAWAFAYDDDALSALSSDQADVFRVKIDNGSGQLWRYGCQSQIGSPWMWRKVSDNGATCVLDNSGSVSWNLAETPHTIHFENVEAGSAGNDGNDPGNVAAISHVVVTNDPNFSP